MTNDSTDSVDVRKWPIVVATGDLGQVSWTPHNGDITEEDRAHLLGEGWLFGDPSMKQKVVDLLDDPEVDSVLVDGSRVGILTILWLPCIVFCTAGGLSTRRATGCWGRLCLRWWHQKTMTPTSFTDAGV